MPLASGIELPERYRVTRHIASGGMASVWEVEDLLLGRVVAVKVLGAQFAADPAARARFQREARTAARVSDHTHIATIYDTGEHGEDAYIVMEYFAGGTVADRMRAARKNDERVPHETVLRWLHETATALDAAHAAGIVHRDVKPANLLIDAQERLAVGDFGIARLADDTQMTQTGQVLGTAAYLSPEQALGQPATAASDRYALAVVAYELLTGTRPFAGGTAPAQARQHAEAEPEAASAAAPDLPPAIDEVFARALAKDPRDRPQTAEGLVAEIERALAAGRPAPAAVDTTRPIVPIVPSPAPPPATPPRRPEPARDAAPAAYNPERRRRAVPWLPVGVAAAAVAAVVLAVALASGGGDGGGERASATTPKQSQPSADAGAQKQPATTDAPATTTPAPPPPPVASTGAMTAGQAARLNDQGYALLKGGDPAGAVPILKRSVDGFRSTGANSNVNYHFALYNLGEALMGAGQPAAAIPYLQERLERSNDRQPLVRQTIAKAQAQANGETTAADGTKKPKKDDEEG